MESITEINNIEQNIFTQIYHLQAKETLLIDRIFLGNLVDICTDNLLWLILEGRYHRSNKD